ncbi:MAG TPA: metallophosphoesterase, partial [Polyangiaceae bacterium]|nr:metallophosphoesterase [Polyangiaceae bacterium]
MLRIAFTSDLHFDGTGTLTPAQEVRRVANEAAGCRPHALVVLGDIGHPLRNFCDCLDTLCGRAPFVGVVSGNHDVWRDVAHPSRSLWESVLAAETRARGLVWLEQDSIVVERTAIVGTMAWYDYSGAEPSVGFDAARYAAIKPQISNDAHWIDWGWGDPEFAQMLRERLVERLEKLEADASVDRVVVATHVPVFEEQMRRDPSNFAWSVANAYFGNPRTGQEIARFPKVRAVVSGHLHTSVRAVVKRQRLPDIHACVVGSDYGNPTWLMLEM